MLTQTALEVPVTPQEGPAVSIDLGIQPRLSDLACAFQDMPGLVVLEGGGPFGIEGRWSYVAADPVQTISAAPQTTAPDGGFLHQLRDALQATRSNSVADVPFQGGAIGYISYEGGDSLHRPVDHDSQSAPAGYLWAGLYGWVIARNALTGLTMLIVNKSVLPNSGSVIETLINRVRSGIREAGQARLDTLASNASRARYVQWVREVKEYISAGDCYQVNLARRISARLQGNALDLFRRLTHLHPEPFSAYLRGGAVEVVSVSPELFLRKTGRLVRSRPIKGTRPRLRRPEDDAATAEALRRSAKDRAENVMIVDVVRNDLGRVCAPGTIEVPSLWSVEAHPSVWQLVSEIRGRLDSDRDSVDLLAACLPPASVTGAPKIRATEIIQEIEPHPRGVYCGTVFAAGFDGSLVSNVAIRTLQVLDREVHLHVGGGIVAGSEPDAEFDETVHKARGILGAFGLRE
ncbi:MAG: aminodeoxychorismate synthase component I [Chloroflexi bacterium]|nr:aminodeoxychorismate synthase component I [Chloroflexota bacterium]MCY3938510.1 aminodeoxychorismate synthase component I [Chloroflexota bacterium]